MTHISPFASLLGSARGLKILGKGRSTDKRLVSNVIQELSSSKEHLVIYCSEREQHKWQNTKNMNFP